MLNLFSGYHEESSQQKKLQLQLEINETAKQRFCGKANIPQCHNDTAWQLHYEKVFKILIKAANKKCNNISLGLESWNDKTLAAHMMYAVSIISTVGWGVYHPDHKSFELKLVTILYALLGLPLFAALLGHAHEGVKELEHRLMRVRWVQVYIGNTKFLGILAMVGLSSFVTLYGMLCYYMKEKGNRYMAEIVGLEVDVHIGPGNAKTDSEWSVLTGIYYVFTTTACIGFGDVYIWDAHALVYIIKPIAVFVVTTQVIALVAHAFRCTRRKMDRSLDRFVRSQLVRNIATKSVQYEKKTSRSPRFVT